MIGKEEIRQAQQVLRKYRDGKANLESRVVDNEQWWKLRHWEQVGKKRGKEALYPTSAWLFNSVLNKHADAMDNIPAPAVLPREQGDEGEARILSAILPVILERNNFESLYSDLWWAKLKSGTGILGCFWDPTALGGMGDVQLARVDILNLFWEPGVSDIQHSANLFHIRLEDNGALTQRYPFLKGRLGNPAVPTARYLYDDTVDTSGKSAVVDWYYKKEGRLQYCKFVADEVLYASENDPLLAHRGFYDHGQYPFVMDVQFPVEGSPAGFGYIDVCKDPQMYIDKLGGLILQNAMLSAKKRFFIRTDGYVNEEEFADWNRDLVHVNGSNLGEDSIREITVTPVGAGYQQVLADKIQELKETSGNRDFNQGGTGGGVTAASAIEALQQAGGKLSRDMVKNSYRAFAGACRLIVELIRQFYDEGRAFRIVGELGAVEYLRYDNSRLRPRAQGGEFGLDMGSAMPVFDIDVRAQKASPFAQAARNEMAKEFYAMGFFDPARAPQALACLEMMDFEGKDALRDRILTAYEGYRLQQLQQASAAMAAGGTAAGG